MDGFDHNTADDAFTAEITDLDLQSSGQRAFASRGMCRWPHFWRVVILGVILFLILVIILGSLPSVREHLWQVLAPGSRESGPPGSIVLDASSDTVAALQSSTGHLLWHAQVNGSILLAPTVSNGVVYFGTNTGDLYAFRLADGARLWHFPTHGFVSSWLVRDGVVYVPSTVPDALYALRASNGSLLWRLPTDGPLSPSLTILKGAIYGVTAPLTSANTQPVSAISAWRARDGVLLWRHQIPPSSPVPLVATDGSVYVSAESTNAQTGQLYALRASDGTLLWQDQVSPFPSAPVLADGTIYVASADGVLSALRARDGAPLWHYRLGSFRSLALAADAGGVFVVILDPGFRTGSLSRLQGSTGSLLWRDRASSPVFALEEIKGVIYLAAEDGTLSALRASDGTLLWSHRFASTTFQETTSAASPFLVEEGNGMLLLRSQDAFGALYALRVRDGALLWHASLTSSPPNPG